jgi:hypothetical protein
MNGSVDSLEVTLAPAPDGEAAHAVDTVRALRPLAAGAFGTPRPVLLELPYTAAADPEIESDIRALLEQIASAVAAELQPAAVLVRGSLGRGEGAAIRVGRETRVTTDVELMAVYAGRGATLRAWAARRRTATLCEALAETLAVPQLDLVTVSARLVRAPPPSLASFEMLRSSRLLTGSAELGRSSAVPLDRVPPADLIARLQRAGNGLLLAWSRLGVGAGDLPEASARIVRSTTDAAFLACGDTWLFRTRYYDHRIAMRAEWLRLPFAAGPGLTDRLREEYQLAAREWLFPSVGASLSRVQSIGRWERAAVEWLGCFRACRQPAWWDRYGLGVRPAEAFSIRRAMRDMVEPALHRDDGRLPVRVQRKLLPLLLEWALDGWDDPARRDHVASLLGVKRGESRDLSYLVLKYMNALKPSHISVPPALRAIPVFGYS